MEQTCHLGFLQDLRGFDRLQDNGFSEEVIGPSMYQKNFIGFEPTAALAQIFNTLLVAGGKQYPGAFLCRGVARYAAAPTSCRCLLALYLALIIALEYWSRCVGA